ncbi:MAG: hypothetical protein L0338_11270 [Acidobacteria bacterium]|nr:hypothetical protein [Acidobacteriota bacterium]
MMQHTIAAVLLEIAYLAAGLLLCYFGKDLLEKGITGTFQGGGGIASTRFRVVTSSPGLVFMLAGLAVVGIAIRTQSLFEQRRAESAPETSGPSMKELAETVVSSRLAEPSADQTFALGQMQAARRLLESNDRSSAMVCLVQAVVVDPALLRTALQDAQISGLTNDATFQTIVRERFKLPLNLKTAAGKATLPILGALGMLANETGNAYDVTDALRQFPRTPELEPLGTTAERLRDLVARNPKALFLLLRNQDYAWVLRNELLVKGLRAEVEAQLADRPQQDTAQR